MENPQILEIVASDNDVKLVKFIPSRILDEIQINAIGQQVISLIDEGARKIVFDFSNVDHLSSSALGMLITIKKRLDNVNGTLKLCNIQSQIFQVFKITRLDKLFEIYDTATEALTSFAK